MSEPRVFGHRAADADLDVVGMRPEDEYVCRPGYAHRVHPNT
jgi:hypothetical protein